MGRHQRENRLQVRTKRLCFSLHRRGSTEHVGIVLAKDGTRRVILCGFGLHGGRFRIGCGRQRIQKEPLGKLTLGSSLKCGKAETYATSSIQPNYARGAGDLHAGFGKIQTQVHALVHFNGRRAVQCQAVLADIQDFIKVQHVVLRITPEGSISGDVHFLPHASAAVRRSES